MRRLATPLLFSILLLVATRSTTAWAPESVYEKDVRVALEEVDKQCRVLLDLKKIDWQEVSATFLERAKAVKSDGEHLALLIRLIARLRDGHAEVRPLAKGTGVRRPADTVGDRGNACMSWCRIGDRIHAKRSWGAAASAGIRPGMQILAVDGVPVNRWLDARIQELSDTLGFSTPQHAFFFACHHGLTGKKGSPLEIEFQDLDGGKKKRAVALSTGRAEPAGPAAFPQDFDHKKDLGHGKTKTGFGYVHLSSCPADLPDQTDSVLVALGNVPGLILDFRGNHGGGFDHDAFLGRFVPRGRELTFGKRYKSAGVRPYGGPIVVIVDGTVISAGETGSGIFKEDGRAYLIGESPTAGMSSQKTTIDLPSGLFSLYVSVGSNKGRFNDGRGIEGIGVIPHEIVEFDPKDLAAGRDTLILRAEALLKNFPKEKVPYDPRSFGWKD